MYLLDTNICIYAIKGKYPGIAEKLLSINPENIKISAITLFELEYGISKSRWGRRSRLALQTFLAAFDIIDFTPEDARLCGELRASLEKSGMPIGAYDIMIAAQGITRNLKVVTHNTSEFERISGIKLEDWANEQKR